MSMGLSLLLIKKYEQSKIKNYAGPYTLSGAFFLLYLASLFRL